MITQRLLLLLVPLLCLVDAQINPQSDLTINNRGPIRRPIFRPGRPVPKPQVSNNANKNIPTSPILYDVTTADSETKKSESPFSEYYTSTVTRTPTRKPLWSTRTSTSYFSEFSPGTESYTQSDTIPNETKESNTFNTSPNQFDNDICKRVNEYISVANSCDEYFECKNNKAYLNSCPDGLYFDSAKKWPAFPCVYPFEVECLRQPIKPEEQNNIEFGLRQPFGRQENLVRSDPSVSDNPTIIDLSETVTKKNIPVPIMRYADFAPERSEIVNDVQYLTSDTLEPEVTIYNDSEYSSTTTARTFTSFIPLQPIQEVMTTNATFQPKETVESDSIANQSNEIEPDTITSTFRHPEIDVPKPSSQPDQFEDVTSNETPTDVSTTPIPSQTPTEVSTTPIPSQTPTYVSTTPIPSQTPTYVSTTPIPSQTPTEVSTTPIPSQTPTYVSTTPIPSQTPTEVSTTPIPSQTPTEVSTTPIPSQTPTYVSTTPISSQTPTDVSTTPIPFQTPTEASTTPISSQTMPEPTRPEQPTTLFNEPTNTQEPTWNFPTSPPDSSLATSFTTTTTLKPTTIISSTLRPTTPQVPNSSYNDYHLKNYTCSKVNGFYSVENRCDEYIECKNNKAFRNICPDGLHFNPVAQWPAFPCAYPSEVECQSTSIIQQAQPTGQCPHQYGIFPSPNGDCGYFMMCQEGLAILLKCPPGLVFNSITSTCDWLVNVPECSLEIFQDFACPSDHYAQVSRLVSYYKFKDSCKQYIACQEGRPRLLSCDVGLSFDEKTNKCVDSDLIENCPLYDVK